MHTRYCKHMTLVVADMSKKATEATILGKECEIYSFSEFAKNNPGLLVWGASNEENDAGLKSGQK